LPAGHAGHTTEIDFTERMSGGALESLSAGPPGELLLLGGGLLYGAATDAEGLAELLRAGDLTAVP
jgi:hypothetical protein